MSVHRGRSEVTGGRSERRDQQVSDLVVGANVGFAPQAVVWQFPSLYEVETPKAFAELIENVGQSFDFDAGFLRSERTAKSPAYCAETPGPGIRSGAAIAGTGHGSGLRPRPARRLGGAMARFYSLHSPGLALPMSLGVGPAISAPPPSEKVSISDSAPATPAFLRIIRPRFMSIFTFMPLTS
jgi:hypothetical protein